MWGCGCASVRREEESEVGCWSLNEVFFGGNNARPSQKDIELILMEYTAYLGSCIEMLKI